MKWFWRFVGLLNLVYQCSMTVFHPHWSNIIWVPLAIFCCASIFDSTAEPRS